MKKHILVVGLKTLGMSIVKQLSKYNCEVLAIDKSDKAIYKAKTGALKSFFASTFLVATKDDPERESQSEYKKNTKNKLKGNKTNYGKEISNYCKSTKRNRKNYCNRYG